MLSIVIDFRLIVLRLRKMTRRFIQFSLQLRGKHANWILNSQGHGIKCVHWKPVSCMTFVSRLTFVFCSIVKYFFFNLFKRQMRSAVHSDLIIDTHIKCITRKCHYLLRQSNQRRMILFRSVRITNFHFKANFFFVQNEHDISSWI